MSRKILDQMADATIVALSIDGNQWPRSFGSETLIPDKWMGLVERRDGRRRLVPAGEDPKPDRGGRLLLVRNRTITVPISVGDTRADCGHDVRGTCELLLRWQARDDDLAALRKTLLDQGELTLDGLARAVADAGGLTALRRFIRRRPASTLVHEDPSDALLDALRKQLGRFLFSSGLTLERVATLGLTSPALARQEALERAAAEKLQRIKAHEMVQQAALSATKRRLDDLGDVLEKLKAAAAGDDDSRWRDLLPALSPADRGRLLENLWRITPDRQVAAAIVVIAGRECLWLDPVSPEQFTLRVAPDAELGGLRSVACCPQRNWLLIGAACGVWAVCADTGEPRARFEVPDAGTPRTGFNAVTAVRDRVYATHSQLGCWSWGLDDPGDAKCILRPAGGRPKTVRAMTSSAPGEVLFAADNRVHIINADGSTQPVAGATSAAISCLAALDRELYVGTADGLLLRQSDFGPHAAADGPDVWTAVHRFRSAIESIVARRWDDLVELVVPAGSDGVCGLYVDEGVSTCLLSSATPIRRAWACDDVIVGLSDNRDKLIVLNANLPQRCTRQVPIARLVGHSGQDACIVVRHEGEGGQGESLNEVQR